MSKILLIEDEAGIRRTLTVSLMQEGHEVEPCENGLSGLAKVDNYVEKGHSFDAVILDINLPDINGLKVLRFLKEKHPNIPVIMITGYGDEAMADEVKARQGDAYLEKPIDSSKLDNYLKDLLDHKDEVLGRSNDEKSDEISLSTKSAYAFIKIGDEEDFLPVYQKLYFDTNVMYCDAVRGVFDLVLLLHGKSMEELKDISDNIQKMDGVDEVYFSSVEKPILSEDLSKVVSEMDKFLIENNAPKDFKVGMNNCRCSAYALLEIEPGDFEKVFRQVYFMDNVVSCDAMTGPFRMSLLLKAPTFAEIDEIVTGKIARMDGVLRASQLNIMNLIEM
ncbi:MAG: response regulator [Candidatus Eremiobacteraeota bacterium]|nr:response regulator [Candidatus Eremiobacteraeota bacterium]